MNEPSEEFMEALGKFQEECDSKYGDDKVYVGYGFSTEWFMRAQSNDKDILDQLPDEYDSFKITKRSLAKAL